MSATKQLTSKRYLALYSYSGTNYLGIRSDCKTKLRKPIYDVLLNALEQFNKKRKNFEPFLRTASRTDQGVHALMNAFTFDTVQDLDRTEYTTDQIRQGLNGLLSSTQEQIRINDIYQTIDPFFDCRGTPQYREYIYKILLTNKLKRSPLELFYRDNAWIVDSTTFDIQKFEEACKLFEGKHCFRNLVTVNHREPDPHGYIRVIDSINVYKRQPELILDPENNDYQVILAQIKAKSFMWHQIRIMMNNCGRYAKGQITKDKLISLLSGDEQHCDMTFDKSMAPAGGLYLSNIKYNLDEIIVK